jgi:hypothetical protein
MRHILPLGGLLLVLTGCADEFGKDTNEPAPDDSGATDTADTGGGNDTGDTGVDTADTGDSGVDTATSDVLVPGSAWCAAGGTVAGGGYRGTFCLAPVDLAAGPVATGGGYTWQPGPVVLLPR